MSITGNFVSTLSSSSEYIKKPDAINLLIWGLELTQNYKSYRKHATKMKNLYENDKMVTEKLSCATLLSFKRQLKLQREDSKWGNVVIEAVATRKNNFLKNKTVLKNLICPISELAVVAVVVIVVVAVADAIVVVVVVVAVVDTNVVASSSVSWSGSRFLWIFHLLIFIK